MEKLLTDCLMGGTLETTVELDEPYACPYVVVVYRVGRQRNWIKLDERQLEQFIDHLEKASIELKRHLDGNRSSKR